MSKLGNVRASDIEKVLRKLGYVLHHQRGSHRYYVKNGKIITVPVHKGKTLGKGLVNKIITKDIGITSDEFFELL
jgi:predicted RNA binding protein YcfA (HicA-like mRNA interferase family)